MFKIYILNLICIISIITNLSNAAYEYCDHNVYLNQSIYIASPNYPKNYYPGTSCRYHIIAPFDHTININCDIKFERNVCSTDFFYISTEGDRELREYVYICSNGNVQRKSLFNTLTIAYKSTSPHYSGAFTCLVTYEKQPCDCGWSFDTKIVGGIKTGLTQYPFMAGILDENGGLYCSGSVISHRVVLTAAHCLSLYIPTKVVVGAHDISNPSKYTKYYEILETRKHPDYTVSKDDNDIAIIATKTIIEWSRGVGPICLPLYYSLEKFVGEQTDFAGWGTTIFGGPRSNILLRTSVGVIDNAKCKNDFPIDNTKMCTFTESHDSCQFDSGGPVIWRGNRLHLIGIVSYGKHCGGNSPGVNTRITSYLNWINSNTRSGFCAKY